MIFNFTKPKPKPLVLIGCRQTWDFIVDTCEQLGIPVLGFVDQYYAGRVDSVDGVPCLGSELDLITNPTKFKDAKFFLGNFWDGNSNIETTIKSGYELRLERMQLVDNLNLPCYTLIDPRSMISKNCEFGIGTYIGRQVNIRAGARVGRHCTITDASGFANDVTLGDNCVLSAGVYLMSNVVLGNNVYVGTRATVLNGHSSKQSQVTIGDDCKIHANALVTKDMEPGTTAVFNDRILKRNDLNKGEANGN
jgi:acetyltransferase-like isoleucine patch superfamily enzyme